MEPKLKEVLQEIDYVCTTADVWKACNRGYFGMTVHWINPATLQCCKATISCTRLFGRNTYDALASKIESVYSQFELCGKVTTTITDNGSNFVKAFKTFSVDSTTLSTSEEVIPQEDDSDQDEEDEEVNFVNVRGALTMDTDSNHDYTQVEYELSPHERCACSKHTQCGGQF